MTMVRLATATTAAQVSAQKNGREPGAQKVTRSQGRLARRPPLPMVTQECTETNKRIDLL